MDRLTTHAVGAKFAELICADPQWLHDEFSALMAANFTAPPAWPRPPAPPTVPPGGHFPGAWPGQLAALAAPGWHRYGCLPGCEAPAASVHLRRDRPRRSAVPAGSAPGLRRATDVRQVPYG